MDNNKDGGSINRPSVLDGSNYIYWKARMEEDETISEFNTRSHDIANSSFAL
jgi:hypothetical protein